MPWTSTYWRSPQNRLESPGPLRARQSDDLFAYCNRSSSKTSMVRIFQVPSVGTTVTRAS